MLAIALIAVVGGVVGGRATVAHSASSGGGGAAGAASGVKVDVIIRATSSEYWQSMIAGSEAAAKDYGVKVSSFGPTDETDIAGEVQLIENSVSRGVDAILIAPSSSDGLNAAINDARKAGIKVITADTTVTATTEGHIGTNNTLAGTSAGQRMCELLTKQGVKTGQVLVESPIAGIEANTQRDTGFRNGLAEKCPNIVSKLQSYNNNDISTAASQVNDAISAHSDLVGVFADNNSSGVGAATAIKDNKAANKIPVVAFDSDPAENAALKSGEIDALVLQNPWFLGYQGVVESAMAVQGRIPPASLDPGVAVADRDNISSPEIKALLKPQTAKAKG
ncbi:ABC transporter substrate-binding protein [Frondihabitans sp. VKM Ac-2883]|uniref:ABC transporter substrate-binding protein n=1 Tax=Frondihabitans sp. VKM Ac-2883 TaxID=2783823 RepID=UPI00351C2A3B